MSAIHTHCLYTKFLEHVSLKRGLNSNEKVILGQIINITRLFLTLLLEYKDRIVITVINLVSYTINPKGDTPMIICKKFNALNVVLMTDVMQILTTHKCRTTNLVHIISY